MSLYESLGAFPGIRKCTATKDEVRDLLLKTNAQTLVDGTLWDIKTKHLGAGIYQVWLERNN